jgi:hypothetical protein
MIKSAFAILLILLFILSFGHAAAQESDQLGLRLKRDFGYSSGTGKIQGAFTLKASGPENLRRVVFFLDSEKLGEVSQAPFELRFHTDSYNVGMHTLYAVGYTLDGQEWRSNDIRVQFVSAEEGWQAGMRILFPMLGLIAAVMILSVVFSLFSARKVQSLPPGAPRKYGFSGGAICPRCSRPFALNMLSFNLGPGYKFDRCPFCGRWAMMRRRSPAELRLAEQAELQSAQSASVGREDEQENLRRELDDSRFQDL